MKKHNGMRPHDIAILLKIASKGQEPWLMKDLAQELFISPSEVSESLHRSVRAKLLGSDKKHLNKLALLEFLKFGLSYVFPLRSGPISRGIKTAISAPPLDRDILSDDQFVWTYGEGTSQGQSLEPLHPKTPEACLQDSKYYELMALTDTLRIGRAREKSLAYNYLKQSIESA